MKKAISLFIFVILIGGFSITNSCKKDNKIRGCMDKDSKDYNATAQEDDGSCLFDGEIVFWYDKIASDGLIADGANALTFYLGGQVIGSSATSVFWSGSPACGQNGSITATEDLGKVKTHAYTLSVKDQTGFEYWNILINIDANTCTQYQLVWNNK